MVSLMIEVIVFNVLINNVSKKIDEDFMPHFPPNSLVTKISTNCYYGQSKVSILVYLAIKMKCDL